MFWLFHGKTSYISYRQAKLQLKQIEESNPEFEIIELDGASTDASTLIEAYSTHGLFTNGKIIFIKRLYNHKERAEILENLLSYCESSPENCYMLLWEDQKIPANTKYLKFFKGSNTLYEAPDLNKRSFITWAKEECAYQEVEADSAALQELAERTNYDPERFVNELKKLKLLHAGKISLKDVEDTTTDTFEYDIWKLLDDINSRDRQKVIVTINRLLKQNVDPHYILAMIFRNIRILTMCKSLSESGADNKTIASKLRIPPFTVPSMVRSVSQISEDQLRVTYEKLTNLDFQIKRGEIDAALGLTLVSTIL